jgi:hypothetical protein
MAAAPGYLSLQQAGQAYFGWELRQPAGTVYKYDVHAGRELFWYAEKILAVRETASSVSCSSREYLVAFYGHAQSEASWHAEKDLLSCQSLIQLFNAHSRSELPDTVGAAVDDNNIIAVMPSSERAAAAEPPPRPPPPSQQHLPSPPPPPPPPPPPSQPPQPPVEAPVEAPVEGDEGTEAEPEEEEKEEEAVTAVVNGSTDDGELVTGGGGGGDGMPRSDGVLDDQGVVSGCDEAEESLPTVSPRTSVATRGDRRERPIDDNEKEARIQPAVTAAAASAEPVSDRKAAESTEPPASAPTDKEEEAKEEEEAEEEEVEEEVPSLVARARACLSRSWASMEDARQRRDSLVHEMRNECEMWVPDREAAMNATAMTNKWLTALRSVEPSGSRTQQEQTHALQTALERYVDVREVAKRRRIEVAASIAARGEAERAAQAAESAATVADARAKKGYATARRSLLSLEERT